MSALAQVLGRHAAIPVVVAADGKRFDRSVCYVGELSSGLYYPR
jgi:hypothetical protein